MTGPGDPTEVVGTVELAPAKLTLSLRLVGLRHDGYHLLDAEMVSLDLADRLTFRAGDGLTVDSGRLATRGGDSAGAGDGGAVVQVPPGRANLVARALEAVGRRAQVHLEKHIPAGAGLGGGSSDAAAVLRWAGSADLDLAASLGADVPFCVAGGRARVTGVGEIVTPLAYEERWFTLLLPPFGVDTAAVYQEWDRLAGRSPAGAGPSGSAGNDLEEAAFSVEPRLPRWRRVFADASGRVPRLAGSGSTLFVEGTPDELGLGGRASLTSGRADARLVGVRTIPAAGTTSVG